MFLSWVGCVLCSYRSLRQANPTVFVFVFVCVCDLETSPRGGLQHIEI
jgi:hypothetical protein